MMEEDHRCNIISCDLHVVPISLPKSPLKLLQIITIVVSVVYIYIHCKCTKHGDRGSKWIQFSWEIHPAYAMYVGAHWIANSLHYGNTNIIGAVLVPSSIAGKLVCMSYLMPLKVRL